jgi:hypothetical protein
MRPKHKRKMIAGLVSAVGAAVLALGTLTAGAAAAPASTFTTTSDGPQSANVPYVAWVGEHVRLVACDPAINTSEDEGQLANFRLEDWSGKPEAAEIPELESGTQAFFAPSEGSPQAESGDGCIKVDYKSLSPGLSRIRAVVTNDAGTIVYSHQFIVIWLTANTPTLTELPYGGDPSGSGEFSPSPFSEPESNADKGLVQVKETGSFPVEPTSLLHNVLPEPSYTLPESWPTLAGALASSSEELEPPGTNADLWDIHGSPEDGPNSGVVGPFDPETPETLLSNGILNADDAPMPAIRVDVHLAANEGGSSLGGVGQISGATKSEIYTDNPYYSAYIPATERPVPQASGVDGPKHGGDFPGFLNEEGPYTFWTSVHSSGERSAESTGCLRRNFGGDEGPVYYQTPSGSLNETFYTDERGEVLVSYTPGDGFYFNHIPVFGGAEGESETGKIVKNADGGCDLKGLYKETIGESAISATVVYPYQPVDFSSETSNTVVKKVHSLWEKEFYAFPKGNGKEETNVRIVVAKAQDIDGSPIVDEQVCFHAQQEAGLYRFENPTNEDHLSDPGDLLGKGENVYLGGSEVTDAYLEGTSELCATTNDEGLAAIDVVNSTSPSVDMTVRYEDEEIVRDHTVSFAGNAGSEEKAAGEKKAAEEKVKAEEKAKAEAKEKGEKELKAEEERVKREDAAEEARIAREAAAETARNEKEKAKEEFEKRTTEEITKSDEKRAAEEAAEKTRREAEVAAESKRRAEEVKAHEEEVAKLAKPLVTPLAGSLTGKGHGKGKAHVASKKKKGKKGKKSKK